MLQVCLAVIWLLPLTDDARLIQYAFGFSETTFDTNMGLSDVCRPPLPLLRMLKEAIKVRMVVYEVQIVASFNKKRRERTDSSRTLKLF
jgi:hypothetical protein